VSEELFYLDGASVIHIALQLFPERDPQEMECKCGRTIVIRRSVLKDDEHPKCHECFKEEPTCEACGQPFIDGKYSLRATVVDGKRVMQAVCTKCEPVEAS
jgi:hypothetical protein